MHPRLWALTLITGIVALVGLTAVLFSGSLRSTIPITVTSDRSGLVMEPGGKVRLRGIEVGQVAHVGGGSHSATLALELDPDQLPFIPDNVEAEIKATTAFGGKFVNLVVPDDPSATAISAGAVVRSRNVTSEANTVFDNLVRLLDQVDPAKLNAIISALSEGFSGRGERIGEAIAASNQVLAELNPRADIVRQDLVALARASAAYGGAAPDILQILDSASTTSSTITANATALDALLVGVIGLSRAGIDLITPNQGNLVAAVNQLEPTTDLLHKYDPIYTCTLLGAVEQLNGLGDGYRVTGGNGRTAMLDAGLLFGDDQYRFPDHLPIVAAKGGPDGKPGCGSLPLVSENYPVRQLVTNTGWGTGQDLRTNPGIGFPGWANYFPVTRPIPEPPVVRDPAPAGPAPGPTR
ncbi:MCE-family protein MCE3A [Mycobacterium sp. MS1601]|uniref:MCE family protein n=1 Tax=Mycobacterium sp. MS1601 TaxID=1936029 RepID=UPI0009795772|nr:MCE family protein [Mycobacterium sp. MS1601]AQA05445.1 MCE-family protein MCE3A [Mycobacterium sp. MS1601]